MRNKEYFIKLIICEYWFSFKHWKGKKWDDKKKSIWLSGMHRAWNLINSDDPIGGLEIVQMSASWSREEAQQWYNENLNPSDEGPIENRFEILDLRPLDAVSLKNNKI